MTDFEYQIERMIEEKRASVEALTGGVRGGEGGQGEGGRGERRFGSRGVEESAGRIDTRIELQCNA